jgi:hypothetical protein
MMVQPFQPAAQISFEIDATPGSGDMPGRIIFSTTTDNTTTLTERMRISNSGNVTISNLGTGLVKSTSGVLSNATGGTDFENPLTFSSPLSRTGNAISIAQSNTSTNGFLSSTDWNTFNNKLGTTLTSGRIFVGNGSNVVSETDVTLNATGGTFGLSNTGELTFPNANTSTRGLLTSADWNTFNDKEVYLLFQMD